MFSFFSNKKEVSYSIILDIQSGLVRGSLVCDSLDAQSSEPRYIVSLVTKSFSQKAHIINSEHLIKKTLKLISETLEHLLRDAGHNKIFNIHYILSSPWIFSKIKAIKVDYKIETEITQKTIANIVSEELKEVSKGADVFLVEQKIFEIRLNGYPAPVFDNKKAHKLELFFITSFSSLAFINKVKTLVQKHINIENSSFHSGLLLQYSALREMLADKHEFIHIHIHNELTDMIIVKDDLCKQVASFPFGISTLLRKISLETKQSIEASDSLLSLYQGKKLSDSEMINLKKILDPLLMEWGTSCKDSFNTMFDITTIPRTVYLSAHSHFDIFKNTLIEYGGFNFSVLPYDSIDSVKDVQFDKGVSESSMMKMYASALLR